MRKQAIADWNTLEPLTPTYALVEGVDLVIVRWDDKAAVLYGRCHHRGALLADGRIDGDNLICGVHGWDYRYKTGISEYNNDEALDDFTSWVEDGSLHVDADEIATWKVTHPQPFNREEYLGTYQDPHGGEEEPYNKEIQGLAKDGLSKTGHHGPVHAMGVPLIELPRWDNIQMITAQLAIRPQLDAEPVGTNFVLGPGADKPLQFDIPLFVSDMSYGALSEEAKIALSTGAELAGTGICSGEGGMLPEEQSANSRYLYELASGRFGFEWDLMSRIQAFHFKTGQGTKTGTGGHLPGHKVIGKIAKVRGLPEGQSAISPATFPEWTDLEGYRDFAAELREKTGGIPVGMKLSAQHIEKDIDAALDIDVDYIILDGRGGGTGASPVLFRNNISVPTIPALARARRHLDSLDRSDVSLIITGGLRTAPDYLKAMALGADAIAVSNAALQAIGCLGMRACETNNCPVGIATQQPHLRKRLIVEESAKRLHRYFHATVELMKVLTRACGHTHLNQLNIDDLTTYHKDMAELAGIAYGGVR
jgi:glutamate synthase domain-containing protein 2